MSEPPVEVIRDNSPHKVEMSEHSKVAVSKTGEAGAPSVRKVLAVPEAMVSEEAAPDEHRVRVPTSLAAPPAEALAVPAALAAEAAADLEIPQEIDRSQTEPAAIAAADSASAPTLDIPAAEAAALAGLDIPRGQDSDAPTLDIPAGTSAAPPELVLAPELSRQQVDAAAVKTLLNELNVAASNETLQEQLGGPDAVWVEMDYPARIVKLKIENDKVRDQLDTLERALGSPADGA